MLLGFASEHRTKLVSTQSGRLAPQMSTRSLPQMFPRHIPDIQHLLLHEFWSISFDPFSHLRCKLSQELVELGVVSRKIFRPQAAFLRSPQSHSLSGCMGALLYHIRCLPLPRKPPSAVSVFKHARIKIPAVYLTPISASLLSPAAKTALTHIFCTISHSPRTPLSPLA